LQLPLASYHRKQAIQNNAMILHRELSIFAEGLEWKLG